MTADEMFEKLGYKQLIYTWDEYEMPIEVDVEKYINATLKSGIEFWKTCDKGISFYGDHIIDKEEISLFLQAINQKCKELGWLE